MGRGHLFSSCVVLCVFEVGDKRLEFFESRVENLGFSCSFEFFFM